MSWARVLSSSVTRLSGSLEKASCISVMQLLGRTGVGTWLWWRGGRSRLRTGTRTEAEERQEMSNKVNKAFLNMFDGKEYEERVIEEGFRMMCANIR